MVSLWVVAKYILADKLLGTKSWYVHAWLKVGRAGGWSGGRVGRRTGRRSAWLPAYLPVHLFAYLTNRSSIYLPTCLLWHHTMAGVNTIKNTS